MALQSPALHAFAFTFPPSSREFLCVQQGPRCRLPLGGSTLLIGRGFDGKCLLIRRKLPKNGVGYGLRRYHIPSDKTSACGHAYSQLKSTKKRSVEARVATETFVPNPTASDGDELETMDPEFYRMGYIR
ncbi:hypothetical protein R1sor_019456 [Riccia sorocarpa]|uniref:Uncharacterized protein n=1 Tax=Riccia sorocarpa TaxID=122646 RepID=A0ABD3IIS8_9MARC